MTGIQESQARSTHRAHDVERDPGCAVAHGDGPAEQHTARLVVLYATPVAEALLRWGRELGFSTVLVEPDPSRVTPAHRAAADDVVHDPRYAPVDDDTDVVTTDHHASDLGPVMAPLVTASPRWVGIMGSPRHPAVHPEALRSQDVPAADIARVRRPIGLDIGSRAPAEIALATLAGLLADRNGRPGGPMA